MTVPIEDLIREAQERQANRAVHPDRIRAGLPARRRRVVRQRQLGMVAVCAAVAGAAAVVTVPIVAVGGHGNSHGSGHATTQAGAPAPGPGSAPAATPGSGPTPTIAPQALGYTIGSPPAGLVERSRTWGSGSGLNPPLVTRIWSAQPVDDYGDLKGSRLDLYVQQTTGGGPASGVTPITVGGKPGWYDGIDAPDKSSVSWKPDAGTLLTVDQHGLNLSQNALISIAESVRPDPATLAPVITFGWLPGAFSADDVALAGNSNTSWHSDIDVSSDAVLNSPGPDGPHQGRSYFGTTLTVTLGTSTTVTDNGEPVSVRGRTGKLVSDPATDLSPGPRLTLVVDLGDGTWLTIMAMYPAASPVSKDDLLHIAEALQLAPPDLAWIGR
jgi:hypothetical protein